jgi:hypothetical protein
MKMHDSSERSDQSRQEQILRVETSVVIQQNSRCMYVIIMDS